jgi:streptogramin lyase
MRRARRLLLAALALAVLAGAPAAIAGEPIGIAERFPTKCDVDTVSAAPGGGAWFACTAHSLGRHYSLHSRARAGRVSPTGQVSEISGPTPKDSSPGEISVTSADGSFWFPVERPFRGEAEYVNTPAARSLARVTPNGQMTLFPISGGAVIELAAVPDGSILMKTAVGFQQTNPVVWKVVPSGGITQTAIDPALPLDATASFPQQPVAPPGTIYTGRALGADGNLWFGIQSGTGAIGRITPTGETTVFTDCLRYSQPYFGPETLVRGVEGNIWFTSLAERSLPNIVDPASIGIVTPAGAITQIYAGVTIEPKAIAADSEGGVWFAGGLEEVQRIKAPVGIVNTFHIGRLDRVRANGSGLVTVKVPGPGELQAKAVAIVIGTHPKKAKRIAIHAPTGTATTDACGSPQVPVQLAGEALRRLRKDGEVRVAVAITFTPAGGTPYTETRSFFVRAPRR